MTDLRSPQLEDSVVRAIVHLNFNEPEQALGVLLLALAAFNLAQGKEDNHGHTIAAAA